MTLFRRDERLMKKVANGDRQAQEIVLARVLRRVHVVSSAILGQPEDAEDATQSALIQIVRRAATYRGESRIESWAAAIAAREAVRLAQERRLRAARTVSEDEALFEPVGETQNLAAEIPRHIRDYLDALPEVLRNTLVLRHVLGYTVPEIAELLETSPNTVKDRLSRARVEIRKMIRRDKLASQSRKVSQS